MKKLFEKANKVALSEIEKYGGPIYNHYVISINKGRELAKKLKANEDLVLTGIALMDVKLGECNANGIQAQHTEKSYEFAERWLAEQKVDKKTTEILLNSVEAHHGKVPFKSLEAEICANADCYRFLTHEGIYDFILKTAERGWDHNKSVDAVIAKMDEKFKLLSIESCKKELEPYYHQIKELLLEAKIKNN